MTPDVKAEAKGLLVKLKALVGIERNDTFTEVPHELEDGSQIIIKHLMGNEPMPNDPVMVVVEGSDPVAIPDGEYKTKDGLVIVTEAGVIKEVKPAEAAAPAEEKPEDMGTENPNTPPAETPAKRVIERVEVEKHFSEMFAEVKKDIEDSFAAQIKTITEELAAVKAENENLKTVNKEMFALVEKIADTPSDTPATVIPGTPKESPLELRKQKQDVSSLMKQLEKTATR